MARVEIAPRAVEQLTEELSAEYLRRYAPAIMFLLQFETPIDTGRLRASATYDPFLHRDGQSRVIRFRFPARNPENGVYYAQIVFAGRGEVRPVRARALRWVTKSGVVVFAQKSSAVAPNRWPIRVFQRLGMRDVRVEVRR